MLEEIQGMVLNDSRFVHKTFKSLSELERHWEGALKAFPAHFFSILILIYLKTGEFLLYFGLSVLKIAETS